MFGNPEPTTGGNALKFYAYANGPAAGKGRVSITKDAKTITDFTPAGNVTEHKDLLVAYNTGTKDNYNSSPVPLTFKHALSQIEVKAKNEKAIKPHPYHVIK